jgi:hypothetical protein
MMSEEGLRMRSRAASLIILLATFAFAQSYGQTPGENQGKPMNGSPAPDTSRMQQQMAAAPAAGPLKISYGDKSAEWTASTLAALPHTTLTLYNEHSKANQTYSGVPLIDLLTKLGVPDKPRGKELRLYLVAEGSDGYQVVYSLGEVTPDIHDGTVMVADAQDGKPIGSDGPLKLVATGEKRPARWVRSLVAVRVLTAQ